MRREPALYGATPPGQAARSRRLRDDVRQEFAFDLRDLVFQQQLAFLEALQLQLIEWGVLRKARDDVVEIAMLGLQRSEPCLQRFGVEVHGRWKWCHRHCIIAERLR